MLMPALLYDIFRQRQADFDAAVIFDATNYAFQASMRLRHTPYEFQRHFRRFRLYFAFSAICFRAFAAFAIAAFIFAISRATPASLRQRRLLSSAAFKAWLIYMPLRAILPPPPEPLRFR